MMMKLRTLVQIRLLALEDAPTGLRFWSEPNTATGRLELTGRAADGMTQNAALAFL